MRDNTDGAVGLQTRHSFGFENNMTAAAKTEWPLSARRWQPLGQFSQQRWQQRQLLVEFAQHGQPEQRVEL